MAVAAAVKFVQGLNIGTPGQALFGVTGTLVSVSNGDNTGVVRWVFEILDVPPGSAVPTGTIQDGALSVMGFTPDLPGGYLVRLSVYDAGNANTASDVRTFGVKTATLRFVPPFMPSSVAGDSALNFGGQTRGWAKYMEEWLAYLDSLLPPGGTFSFKEPCRVASTANINLGVGGLLVIDGVATIATDRVLVKNQALPEENGIYNVSAGAWTRAADADTSPEVKPQMVTRISEGTLNANLEFYLATTGTINLGVTPLTFATFDQIATTAPVDVTKAAAAVGVSAQVARADHKHDISTATAVSVGTANAEGVATSLSRSDHVHKGSYLQTIFAEATVDVTTNSVAFVSLLSQNITIQAGSIIEVDFSTCAAVTAGAAQFVHFRLQIDGVTKRATCLEGRTNGGVNSASLVYRQAGLAAGLHTVLMQWRVSGGTGAIRVVTAPDSDHASLIVREITV